MATLRFLAEQVMLRLTGGRPDIATKTDIRDIMAAVVQDVNEQIGVRQFQVTMANGETIPDGVVLATYDNVPVTTYQKVSKAKLPVIPVQLPRGMGVFAISPADDMFVQYIPAQAGQIAMVRSQRLLNTADRVCLYEPRGSEVIFEENLVAKGVSAVQVTLVVKDVSGLHETDPLPIPADYEAGVVDRVFTRFAQQGRPDEKTDVQKTYS